jgi:hypothetical protein
MLWQETNEEAGKCGFEESVNKLLWATSNHDFHCCPMASGVGPAARPGRGRARGSAALGPDSMKAVTRFRHPCAAQTHCSLLKLVSDFALFIPVFHLEFFFWLVQVRKAISTLRLKAANRACKRAVGVCLLVLVLGRHIHAFSLSASPWFMGIEFLGRLLTRVNSLLALAQRFIYYYI